MAKGQEYSVEVKAIYFRVIDFIETERNKPMILLNLTIARILAILDVSEKSLFSLKAETKHVQDEKKRAME